MTYTFKLAKRLAICLTIGVLVLMALGLGLLIGSPVHHLPPILQQWIVAALGSALVQIFSLHKGFGASLAWLKQMFPSRSEVFYFRWNFLLSWASGTIVGMLVMQPDDIHGALTAGLTWPFIIQRLVDKTKTASLPGDQNLSGGPS
jgi:hypothetical protein